MSSFNIFNIDDDLIRNISLNIQRKPIEMNKIPEIICNNLLKQNDKNEILTQKNQKQLKIVFIGISPLNTPCVMNFSMLFG